MGNFFRKRLSFLPSERREHFIFVLDLALNIIIMLGAFLIIRNFLISPFRVSGPSMCDTLNYIQQRCESGYGEYIIVNKLGYQNFFGWRVGLPQRGDIVVFRPPRNGKEFFIKRVIGIPGDTIKLQDGEVFLYNAQYPDGVQLRETYLNDVNRGNTNPSPYKPHLTSFQVPEGQYFVLGDNRVQSSDSRTCFKESPLNSDCGDDGVTPFITPDLIEGKAWLVLWPLEKIAVLEDPKY